MVKLLNTPFGNYGYVQNFNKASNVNGLSLPVKPIIKQRNITNLYEAKFLGTTSLQQGSRITRARDPDSYMKRGLLHKGQLPEGLPMRIDLPSLSKESSRVKQSATTSGKNDDLQINIRKMKVSQLAGVPTFSRQPRRSGGVISAQQYASNRSELSILMSGRKEEDDDVTSERTKTGELVRAEVDMSELNLLKSRRLNEVYTTMSQKHRQHRESIIMERVSTAEKIHTKLREDKLRQRKDMLRTSLTAQCNQLRKVRRRYDLGFESRLSQVYADEKISPRLQSGTFSVPREMFGLPERIPAPKFILKAKPRDFQGSKLAMDSYKTAKCNITNNFNNVWNLTLKSPRLDKEKLTTT